MLIWFIGFVMGMVTNFAVGVAVIGWHFKAGYFLVDESRRTEYLKRFGWEDK